MSLTIRALSVLVILAASLPAQDPVSGNEIFLSGDWQNGGCGYWDNLVLEDEFGQRQTFLYNFQFPVAGLSFEPYNGSIFDEGDYSYESIFVDYTLDILTGSPHHHPQPVGGNPGGHTWVHDPMAIRIFRGDNRPFRIVSIDYRDWVNSTGLKAGPGHLPSSWQSYPLVGADSNWRTYEFPILGAAAAGQSAADVLRVNGSDGGSTRSVDSGLFSPLSISVLAPQGQPNAEWVLYGSLGTPETSDSISLPLLNQDFLFTPCDLAGGPDTFTLAESLPFSACGALIPATPAPWSVTFPSISAPLVFALQALVVTSPTSIDVSNGIRIHVD